MGLFGLINSINNLKQDTSSVKNARQQIFDIQERLRNTPQFSDIFYNIIKDMNHPPMQITIDYTQGNFFSIDWDTRTNNYEPYSTIKYQDANIAYHEGCAIFLLIQESYPNVYDFPSHTMSQIEAGVPLELKMKKPFLQKQLVPAKAPQRYTPAPCAPIEPASPNATPKFCGKCGSPLQPGTAFCTSCGNKIG